MSTEDGRLALPDGRILAWQAWGRSGSRTVLRIQGTAGSRLPPSSLPAWQRLGLRGLAVDRPGFGHSTRLPGRGVRVVADDLARLLDSLGIKALPVIAHSGGGPHGLAFAACYPERVESLTVVSGACPLLAEERRHVVHANAVLADLVERGWDAVHDYLAGLRATMIERGTPSVIGDTDPRDLRTLSSPAVQRRDAVNRTEALRQGAAGWADETMALVRPWDFDVADVHAQVRWWHGAHDSVVPMSAVERLTKQLGNCELRVLDDRAHYLPAPLILPDL